VSTLLPYLHLALWAWAAVSALMFILWLISLKTHNASIVDPGWTFGLLICTLIYAAASNGYEARKALIVLMAGVWACRLGLYLFFSRIWRQPEEGRYQQLRKEWKSNINFKFLLFFEFQALLDVVLSVPFLVAALNPRPELSFLELAGLAIWAIAMVGEAIADAQLNRFKKNPANKGKTCQVGLWNYSRHPNYFFEWLVWVGWFIFALGSPYGWFALTCPLLMLYFLFKVTGIPATEAQALRSRGEDYRRYQQTTSVFVPWFKKSPSADDSRLVTRDVKT
jgi:steroid 5-alpha reductase family enzyme